MAMAFQWRIGGLGDSKENEGGDGCNDSKGDWNIRLSTLVLEGICIGYKIIINNGARELIIE